MSDERFRLRKKLLLEAKDLDGALLQAVKDSPVIQAFINRGLVPWLEYARDLAIRAEYDSLKNGNSFSARAEGFEAVIRKLEALLKRAAKKQDKENADG